MLNDCGKGSTPRPLSVDEKTFEDNWNKIFKRHQELKGTVDKLNKQLDNSKDENTGTGG